MVALSLKPSLKPWSRTDDLSKDRLVIERELSVIHLHRLGPIETGAPRYDYVTVPFRRLRQLLAALRSGLREGVLVHEDRLGDVGGTGPGGGRIVIAFSVSEVGISSDTGSCHLAISNAPAVAAAIQDLVAEGTWVTGYAEIRVD